MIRIILIPLLLAGLTAWVISRFNLWKTRQELTARSRVLRHPPVLLQAERLAQALDMPKIEVMELQDPVVNGLADADGRIFLTSGFLQAYGAGRVSAEELASVIAHEMGHVAQGHVKRRMRDVMGHQTALMAVNILLARFVPFIGPWLASKASTALMMRSSRRDEFEADASALLIKAGIGTEPQKALFLKLEALTGSGGASLPDWLRSHPNAADRIRAIEENEARWSLPPR